MYDAIIIGARCAGAPTAMLLSRKGYRVLLVDRATFPSDTISTHIVWPQGAELMNKWGLLDSLAETGCPPVALNLRFDVGPFALTGGIVDRNDGLGGFCPRRTVLDKLLVDAAAEAGAEVREGFTVEALQWDDDRVAGIKGHTRKGTAVQERARVVIGADGIHSQVAKAVRPQEYDTKPALTTNYYSYFSGFEANDIEMYVRDGHAIGCFPTHDNQTLIAVMWPASRFEEIRSDVDRHFVKALELAPSVAERVRASKREEKWHGIAGVPNYFRKPYGPGWALDGDAAYNKDPITAQGISDAFIDAQGLADALDDGWSGRRALDEALAEHHEKRDARVKALFDFTCGLALLEPPPPHMQQLFAAMRGNREVTSRFYSAITGSSPLPAFLNPENISRIVASASGEASRSEMFERT